MFNLIRRKDATDDPLAFAAFHRQRSAFLAQKTVLDYCRVKAGRDEVRLFTNPDFQAALRHCRWQVFLAAAADVAALAESWLRPHASGQEARLAGRLAEVAADSIRAEGPPAEEADDAEGSIAALPGHLAARQAGPPLSADQLPLLAEAPLFATLPIHPDQRQGEGVAIRGALRLHLVSAGQEMERMFAPGPLTAALLRG